MSDVTEVVEFEGLRGRYALGLAWVPEFAKPPIGQLRERSLELGMRWGVMSALPDGSYQTGWCAPIAGVKNAGGVRALALALSGLHPAPWRGVFRIDATRYWYIAIGERGAVLPESDRIGTLDQLARVRERHADLAEWHDVGADAPEDIAAVLPYLSTARRVPFLRDYQASPWRVVGATVLVALLGGAAVGGYLMWQDREEALAVKAAQARRALAEMRAQAESAAKVAAARVPPWTGQPSTRAVMTTCALAWDEQRLAEAGWLLSAWQCKASGKIVSVIADWKRDGGLAQDAPGEVSTDGEHARASSSLALIESDEPDASEAQGDGEDPLRAVWTFAQTSGASLKVDEAPAQVALPGASKAVAALAPWMSRAVTMTLSGPGWLVLPLDAAGVPGLYLSATTYDARSGAWEVSGKLYARRPGANEAADAARGLASTASGVAGRDAHDTP